MQDPYLLDFLGLKDTYSEKDLEAGLLREIERFLLELGTGFAFLERQKRITLDGDDYYIDLLFYHRRLRRLVVIELKLGISNLLIPARWSCICGGWIVMSASRGRNRRSRSSSARERNGKR